MKISYYVVLAILLMATELLYLSIARRIGIVDKPNERSAHVTSTIRGGGVIVWLAAMIAFVSEGFRYPWTMVGLTLIASISFRDDVSSLSKRLRVLVQIIAVAMLLSELPISSSEFSGVIGLVALLVGVGILNAHNFLDGINGMMAFYGLVTVVTLWYGLWAYQSDLFFVHSLLPFTGVSLLVFSWFNARRKAICFAGDVGSISLGFIVLMALAQFVIDTQSYLPLLLITLYGTDTALTIIHRLYLRQPIFQAHRIHLFQLLVHKLGWSHLLVSLLYAFLQLLINVVVLAALRWSFVAQAMVAATIVGTSCTVFMGARVLLMKLKDKKIVDPAESTIEK